MSPTGKRNAKASDASTDPVMSVDPPGPSTPADRGEEDSLERHTTPGLGPLATAPSKTDVTDGTVSPPPSRQDQQEQDRHDDASLDDEVEASIASAPSTDDDREALRGLP